MDRNDSNPGMVERQMDETPMHGRSSGSEERSGSGMDRDHLQRGGSVEREGMQGDGTDRDSMRGSELERDGMGGMNGSSGHDGGPMEGSSASDRESMHGSSPTQDDMSTASDQLGVGNTSSNDSEMRSSTREGGYGYDRPTDIEVRRDDMEGSSRGTSQGTDRERPISGDQSRGNTTARDW
jgi:hypothetical protein